MMNNRSIKILLIDDNLNDAELMIRTLKKNNLINYVTHLKDDVEGFPFIFCTDPFLHRDVTYQPNAVFLDLKMPRVNRMEALEKMKQTDIQGQFLSSCSHPPSRSRIYTGVTNPLDMKTFQIQLHK